MMIRMPIKTRHLFKAIRHSYDCSIISTATATPTWIHQFSEYSLVCRHVNLTVSFRRCFREPVQLTPPYATMLCFMMRPTILDKSVGTPALFRSKSPLFDFPLPDPPLNVVSVGWKCTFSEQHWPGGRGDVTLRKRDPPERRKQSD